MKLSYLFKGLPGHPLHPPLTDVVIGAYALATALAIANITDLIGNSAAHGWWLALLFGLAISALAATTGLIDWLDLAWRSPLWWTATWHLLSMVTATVFFGLAAIFGHDDWLRGDIATGEFVLTVVGFGFLMLGGFLGGSVVFVHGMRVLKLVEEPPPRATAPVPTPEKEEAAGGA